MAKRPTGNQPYQGCGPFEHEWANPPAPFNPDYDPHAKARFEAVTASMEADDYYRTHNRHECAIEWRRRYEELKAVDQVKQESAK